MSLTGIITTERAIDYLELGVRCTQVAMVNDHFSDGVAGMYPPAMIEALDRLSLIICSRQLSASLAEASVSISSLLERLNRQSMAGEYQSILRITLRSLKNRISQHLESGEPEESQLAFRFGIEIANGRDDTWSEGAPRAETDAISDTSDIGEYSAARIRLRFDNPTPPRWDWFDRNSLRQVASQLQVDESLYVPSTPRLDEGVDLFQSIPCERIWGWLTVEAAINRIRLQGLRFPRWDAASRTLYVGDTPVRSFSTRQSNQRTIIEEFADQGWPADIRNPLSHARQKTNTVRDLNDEINPKLIQFYGTGDTGVRWELTNDSGS